MANILTDAPATYNSDAVFNPAKANATPRLPSESWQYATAQWGTEVDTALISINSWMQGSSPAGTAGSSLRTLGRLLVAENAGLAGGDPTDLANGLAVGATSSPATSVQIQTTNSGVGALYFSDLDDADAGGFSYAHTSNTLDARINGTSIFQLTSAGLLPSSNVTYTLGSSVRQWSQVHSAALRVTSSATLGLGAAAFDLVIDGGAGGGQEPRLVLQQSSIETGSLAATSAGDIEIASTGAFSVAADSGLKVPRLTTAQRTALVDAIGLVVYDTTENLLYWNNGSGWFNLASGASGTSEVTLTIVNASLPAGDGASASFTTGTDPVVLYPDLSTKRAEWIVKVPASYSGGNVTATFLWTGFAGSTDNVEWEFSFQLYKPADDLSVNGLVSSGTFVEPGPAAGEQLLEATKVFSNAQLGGPTAGEKIRVSIARNGGAVADVYGNAVYLLAVDFAF